MGKIKKLFGKLGPGFITGASDDDPSGIATYAQTGARFGFGLAWMPLFTFFFMVIIQEMCGRIGMVTGKGLSGVIRQHYSKKILYLCVLSLLIANIVTVGANLGAMASAAQMLVGIPFVFLLIGFTIFTLIAEIFISYKQYAKVLKFFAFSLLAYIFAAFTINLNWADVAISAVVPSFTFSIDFLLIVMAILGATMSPYLFFWQASEEVEEDKVLHKIRMLGKGISKSRNHDIFNMRIDTMIGMFFSNLVMFFIIITTASTLGVYGITQIETADQAALALRPLAGDFAYVLFAVGIIGTGLLAVPILAGSASYAISEAFNWKAGLGLQFRRAHGFYGVITISTLVGLLINFSPIEPFRMLFYSAILNGIFAPPLLIMILLISNNKKIMGQYTNSKISNIFGVIITVITLASVIGIFLALIFNLDVNLH